MTENFTEQTWQMVCTVADIKGWHIETTWDAGETEPGAVKLLERNWNAFVAGGHKVKARRPSRKIRKLNGPAKDWHSEDEDESQ